MNNIKEKLLEKIMETKGKCRDCTCYKDCKYYGTFNCSSNMLADAIMDNFVVAEKLELDLNSIHGKSIAAAILEERPKKTITDVIFVEDGSVDTDELKKQFGDNVPVIVYRQGGARPEIRHLESPIIVTDKPKSDNTDSASCVIGSYKHENSNKEYDFLKKIVTNCSLTTVNSDDVNISMNSDEEQVAIYTRIVITPEERRIINSLKGRLEVESK